MIITGIGSRPKNLPKTADGQAVVQWLIDLVQEVGEVAKKNNWVLRSGAADGMDSMFEAAWGTTKEIFLPYDSFNRRCPGINGAILVEDPLALAGAQAIASKVHPVWKKLDKRAKEMHTRNVFQALGEHLDLPSDVCIYYAPVTSTGEVDGGTRTAVVICQQNNIPTYNLRNTEDVIKLRAFLDEWR